MFVVFVIRCVCVCRPLGVVLCEMCLCVDLCVSDVVRVFRVCVCVSVCELHRCVFACNCV